MEYYYLIASIVGLVAHVWIQGKQLKSLRTDLESAQALSDYLMSQVALQKLRTGQCKQVFGLNEEHWERMEFLLEDSFIVEKKEEL